METFLARLAKVETLADRSQPACFFKKVSINV